MGTKSDFLNFIGYVVSDNPSKYPDGGEQKGFWYERLKQGLVPTAFDENGYMTTAEFDGNQLPAGLFDLGYKRSSSSGASYSADKFLTSLKLEKNCNIGTYAFYSNSTIKTFEIEGNSLGNIGDYAMNSMKAVDMSNIPVLTITGNVGVSGFSMFANTGVLPSKIKFKGTKIGASGFAHNYGNNTKIWIASSCTDMSEATSAGNGQFYNSPSLTLYCEHATAQPWNTYFKGSSTVQWGVSESQFDAL